MKKAIPVLIFIIVCLLQPPEMSGQRQFKPGDTIPLENELKSLDTGKKRVILIIDSTQPKSGAFFGELVPALNTAASVDFFLVDTAGKLDPKLESLFNSLKPAKKYIPDNDKKIYSRLGVIVKPSLLLVTEDNRLHSSLAGMRRNLPVLFKEYIKAFLKGEDVGVKGVFKEQENRMAQRKVKALLKQGLVFLAQGNFQLASNVYRKVSEKDPENESARLGIGYALFFSDRLDESLAHFTKMKEESPNGKRAALGYYLCLASQSPAPEALDGLVTSIGREHVFFPVIFRAADLLDRQGRCEESKKAYARAYKILVKNYGRNP